MTNSKTTRRALLTSVMALLLCFTMLLGTTFAWFTDSVTSANNIIKSGTLDVTMEWADGTKAVPDKDSADWKDASTGAIFSYEKWEPGYVEVRHIKIANEGTLALKYQLSIIANDEVSELADVIDVYFVDPATQVDDRSALTNEVLVGTLAKVLKEMPDNASGKLYPANNEEGKASEVTVTIALKMQETAGNEYMDKSIGTDFSVQLLATQLTAEPDSFDNKYDEDAKYPGEVGTAAELAAALKEGGNIKLLNNITLTEAATVPAGVTATLDLNGKTLSGSIIAPDANLTIENGTLNNDDSSVSAIEINAGELTLNDVEITSARHAVRIDGNVTATINGGTYGIESSVATQHAVNVSGGANVTINGGIFVGPAGTTADSGSAVMVQANSTVTINGGNFSGGKNDTLSGAGTIIVMGGTFDQNPGSYVANGYEAKNDNGTWTVTEAPVAPQQVNGIYQVSKPAELAWLAASESKINHAVLTADIDMKGATISSIEIEAYRTFDGNGHKISNVVVDGNGLFENTGSEITIKNITLDNVTVNATGGEYAGIVSSKFCGSFENVTVLNSTVYAPNSEYVGGLAGAVYKDMVNCKVEKVSVTGSEKVGGLVGFFTLNDVLGSIELKDCSAKDVTVTATNTAKSEAGVIFGRGLAPENSSWKFTFTNCSAQLKDGQVLIGNDYYSNIDTSAIVVTQ